MKRPAPPSESQRILPRYLRHSPTVMAMKHLAVGLVAALVAVTTACTSSQTPVATPTATVTVEVTPTPTTEAPTTAATTSAAASAGPAAANAYTRVVEAARPAAFVTPSGNVVCQFAHDYVRCEIRESDFAAPPLPASCGPARNDGHTLRLTETAEVTCAGPSIVGTAAVGQDSTAWLDGPATTIPGSSDGYAPLRYGEALQVEDFRCGSAENGVTCLNLITGHGFRLSRAAYDIF